MLCCRYFWLSLLVTVTLLTACNGSGALGSERQVSAVPDAPTRVNSGQPPSNQCNAQAAQTLVGQLYASELLPRALVAAGADEARMLREGDLITQEYVLGRVNVVVGGDGRVVRVRCG